jgi:hypothetical protein
VSLASALLVPFECHLTKVLSFESRTVCEEVIKKFNNYKVNVGGEEYTIQIRFADTQEQKQLKQQTAAARQFRSAEYEYATQAHKAGYSSSRGSYVSNNEFETYMTTRSVHLQTMLRFSADMCDTVFLFRTSAGPSLLSAAFLAAHRLPP